MAKVNLKIDWATHESATFACEKWHYSKCVPKANLVKIGAWEDGRFIGVIIFGHGGVHEIGSPYGLTQFQCVELVRIALTNHVTPVSRIMTVAIKFLKKRTPKIRLIVSYADPSKGHHGGIYQASNWIYEGQIAIRDYLRVNGSVEHPRTLHHQYGTSSIEKLREKGLTVEKVPVLGKYKYLMPIDDDIRRKVEQLRKPYPKRAVSRENAAASFQEAEDGANPITALQSQEVTHGRTA